MKEVEVKILEVDREELTKKLLVLGAKKTFEGEMIAVYFDDGKRKANGVTIRLRMEGDRAVFVIKKKISKIHTKIVDEREVEVKNFDAMIQVLELLDLKEYLRLRKKRIQYEIGKVHFVFDKYLDEWGYIPELMEIESDNEDDVFIYAEKLGISKEQCKSWSGFDLYRHYTKE